MRHRTMDKGGWNGSSPNGAGRPETPHGQEPEKGEKVHKYSHNETHGPYGSSVRIVFAKCGARNPERLAKSDYEVTCQDCKRKMTESPDRTKKIEEPDPDIRALTEAVYRLADAVEDLAEQIKKGQTKNPNQYQYTIPVVPSWNPWGHQHTSGKPAGSVN